jgi:multidrug efflux pump subunit AcrB
VIGAIRSENVTIPGGSIDVGTQAFLVRMAGEFHDPDIIGGIVVKVRRAAGLRAGRRVRGLRLPRPHQLRAAQPQPGRHAGHREAVSGQNIIATADAVKAVIEARGQRSRQQPRSRSRRTSRRRSAAR